MGKLLAARLQHRQGIGKQRAPDAKPEGVDAAVTARNGGIEGDVAHHLHRPDHTILHIIVPGQVSQAGVRVAPGHDESAMPLLHRKTHQRVVGLQVEDVVLVDRRRHEQQRPRMHFRGERPIVDELEQRVLEHHIALGGRDIAPDLEDRLVRLGHAALFQVIEPVLHAEAQTLPLCLHRLVQRLGVEREEVRRRGGVHPLLDGEAQLLPHRFVGLHAVGQIEHGAGAEQVKAGGIGGDAVFTPCSSRKPAIAPEMRSPAACVLIQQGAPELAKLVHIALLQFLHARWIDLDLRQSGLRGLREPARQGIPGLRPVAHPLIGRKRSSKRRCRCLGRGGLVH
ncbi:hypothetical protein GALL_523610 [mine drainage metagenome]|uniref:Uncharacterized protein n=1 Tax=mine drainage metagenome TaxID=410659 RepID=A0A1J5PLB0_9ZZZZ